MRVAVLEAHRDRTRRVGPRVRPARPYLKHSHRKIVADFGAERGAALSDAVAAAPAEIAAFIERHQIACAATRSGILIGARTEAGRRRLEETARQQPDAQMLYGADAARIVGSDFYKAVLLDPRGLHVDPLAYARGLARVAKAHGALIHPRNARRSGRAAADRPGSSVAATGG